MRQGGLFNLIALSSPVAIVIAVRSQPSGAQAPLVPVRARPGVLRRRRRHHLQLRDVLHARELPFPSLADVLYLSVYPCLIAGHPPADPAPQPRARPRQRDRFADRRDRRRRDLVGVPDGAVRAGRRLDVVQKLVSIAYPFMDLILLTAVVRLAIGPGRRGLVVLPPAGGRPRLFVTDFVVQLPLGAQGLAYDQSGLPRGGSGVFYLLWGAAALHASMRHLAERAPDQEVRAHARAAWSCSARRAGPARRPRDPAGPEATTPTCG